MDQMEIHNNFPLNNMKNIDEAKALLQHSGLDYGQLD